MSSSPCLPSAGKVDSRVLLWGLQNHLLVVGTREGRLPCYAGVNVYPGHWLRSDRMLKNRTVGFLLGTPGLDKASRAYTGAGRLLGDFLRRFDVSVTWTANALSELASWYPPDGTRVSRVAPCLGPWETRSCRSPSQLYPEPRALGSILTC